jgi:diaminopimelate decarboxylase
MDKRRLLNLASKYGTPLYVYDRAALEAAARKLLKADLPYGLVARYAVKANPHPEIVKLFDTLGLHFDASSAYEAAELIEQGVSPEKISLSGQTLEGPAEEVLSRQILPVATSLHQIDVLHGLGVKELGLRVNPGIGSGHNNRTNVGGPSSSFGVWHEYLPEAIAKAKKYDMTINRLHTHIGSGADPKVWKTVIGKSLEIAEKLPEVTALDIGGGYKVARMAGEIAMDMDEVFAVFSEALRDFRVKTGRELKLEIEPGSYLVANAGTLLARVEDIVDTGPRGYTFLRLNTGMNDILRPSLYGAQHPIEVLNGSVNRDEYVVVGHNCESGDILTPAPGDPEGSLARSLNRASIGDVVAIGGVGAYCASMRAGSYNSFPGANEVVV